MELNNYYQTTTLPYVNAEPHLGFALEIILADAMARYKSLSGKNVFFNFGTDEHGQKIYQKAIEEKKNPKEYCDEYAAKFDSLKKALNLTYNNFIRTTDEHHVKAAQEFWRRCDKNGDIYKRNYKAKYCVGCELEKTDSELTNGRCPVHPNRELEVIEEENYFFRFSRYQKPLLDFYNKTPNFVVPDSKFNEIKTFVENGLQDFSISRLKTKMPWGIDVPDDPAQVMFVWFDALVNYVSAIGWPDDTKKFETWWPVVQFAGKDNLRQQAAIWQAMLMSAGLANSKQIFIHGFITVNGQKISKSLGNAINPIELVKEYGTDTVRYYLLAKVSPFEDGDFSETKLREVYNSDLAHGLGNLASRILTMAEKYSEGRVPAITRLADDHPLRRDESIFNWKKSWKAIDDNLAAFQFNEALIGIWRFIGEADRYIDQQKPWVLAKEGKREELNWVLYGLLDSLHQLAWQILPFLPETSQKIARALKAEKLLEERPNYKDSWTNLEPGTPLEKIAPLFPLLSP